MGFTDGDGGDAYRDFEDIFRGDEDFIRERQRFYLSMLNTDGPVLDAGSGRGEFLDLLSQGSIEAIGVDLDRGMVDRCTAKGHNVVLGDVIDYLRDAPDGYFGTVFRHSSSNTSLLGGWSSSSNCPYANCGPAVSSSLRQ